VEQLVVCASFSFLAKDCAAQVADAGPDTSLCVNFYTLQGSPLPPGATGQWVLYSGCGTFMNSGSPTTLITDLCIGTNVAGWVVDDNGTISTDQVVITFFDANMAVADAGPDTITVVVPQSSAFLAGSPTPIYPATCWWTWLAGSGVIADPNDPNTMASGLTIGDNILLWTCDNGPCGTTSDTLVIQMMMFTALDDAIPQGSTLMSFDAQNGDLLVGQGSTLESLDILDINGRVLTTRSGPVHAVEMETFPDGIYLARAVQNGMRRVFRFVVNR